MKRKYTSSKYKRRSKILLKKRKHKQRKRKKLILIRKKKLLRIKNEYLRHKHSNIRTSQKGKQLSISAPEDFSIVNNINEMMDFFDEVYMHVIDGRKRILLDLSRIKTLTPDALLYLLSLLEYYTQELKFKKISGNYPSEPNILKIFEESGFTKYVLADASHRKRSENILSIESHDLVQGKTAKKVVDFTKNKLKTFTPSHSRSLYATLIECMANVKNHAYSDKKRIHPPKWWLIAHHDETENKIKFVFLDNGVGIPSTIHKKFDEVFKKTLGFNNDSQLILSVLDGDFRTRTKQEWRGKGLPKIFEYFQQKRIENLIIISNKGFIVANGRKTITFDRKFRGTLLSWDIV